MKLHQKFFVLIILFFCFTSITNILAQVEKFNDPLLDKLSGNWKMKGVVREDSVKYDTEGKWTLNHQFFLLHMRDINNPPGYEAMVYIGFNNNKKNYVVHWLDQFGGTYSETLGHGNSKGDSINILFNYPDGDFKDTFTYLANKNQWHFLLEDKNKDGTWQKFAEYILEKKE
jgi:Protein of unknown function (DUF1579)